jgi:hypothetical protein
MREQLQARLKLLRKEFETGHARLRDLELQQAVLRETLFRISGAIQVLEELLAGNGAGPGQDVKALEGEMAAAPPS